MSRNTLTSRYRVATMSGLVLLMLASMALIPLDVLWPEHKAQQPSVSNPQVTIPETKRNLTWEAWSILHSQQHKYLPFEPLILRPLWEIQ